MNLHPQAVTLNLLLSSEHMQPQDQEYATHRVIARYLNDWPEEKKADLYAQLAERYNPKGKLFENERVVSDCLWSTDIHWAKL